MVEGKALLAGTSAEGTVFQNVTISSWDGPMYGIHLASLECKITG